ncbi:MAG: hypothetical protein HYZ45_06555 [Burkholderiales bacterium]|nr:hypothetical protein [Burkholderiales bacterium]
MIESEEGGRTFVRREEFRLRIKLFVLFNFYSEYASVPEMAEFFHGKEFNEALFDRLWTLKEVEEVIQFPKWSEKIQYTAPVPRLPQTDSEFVNRWLSEVVWFQAPPEQDNSYE